MIPRRPAPPPPPPPPEIINNPDGTVSIKGTTVTYTVVPTRKFRINTTCLNNNQTFDGKRVYGTTTYKDYIVEVNVLINSFSADPGLTGMSYQVFRSADIMFTWDHTKLEFIDAVKDSFLGDGSTIDYSKLKATVLEPGKLHFHSEVLPPPELRTPAQLPQYFQWNLGGYLWGANPTGSPNRHLGKLRFRVKTDFYHPTPLTTDIFAVHQLTKSDGTIYNSRIDGSPVAGTDVLGEIRNNSSKIENGPSPAYKVSHSLIAPTTPVKMGDAVPVKIVVNSETSPQRLASVSTIFSWDPSKLEFMGIDKTGAKPSMYSTIDTTTAAGTINESAVPKDGNAQHKWLSVLGDRNPIDKETTIVTLNFKAVSDFYETSVNIINKLDPRMLGATVLDDTGILGSVVPGTFVSGTINHAVIKGLNPPS